MRWDWIMVRAKWFTFQRRAGNVYSGSWWQGSTKAAVIASLTQLQLTNEWRHRDLPEPHSDVQYHNSNVRWDIAVICQRFFLNQFFFATFSFINSICLAQCLHSVEMYPQRHILSQVCENHVELWLHVSINTDAQMRLCPFLCFHTVCVHVCSCVLQPNYWRYVSVGCTYAIWECMFASNCKPLQPSVTHKTFHCKHPETFT